MRKHRIKNRLKILMATKDIKSLAELSRETGIFYGTLNNFYNQKFDVVNYDIIVKLCEYFDCQIEDLLELVPVEEKIS